MECESKTYLVCPLNWGLGHAGRMIPFVANLLQKGNTVVLAGDGNALKLISDEFPQLETITIADVNIKLSRRFKTLNLIALVPKIIFSAIKEHLALKRILAKRSFDVVVSDNRYGLWNKKAHSIFITHQLMLKLPKFFGFAERFTHKFIKHLISNFDQCLIPDYEDKQQSLSGDLSHKYPLPCNAKFIGTLSRFAVVEPEQMQSKYDVVAVLSGPEPLRSEFENILIRTLKTTTHKSLIVCGLPLEEAQINSQNNIYCVSHLSSAKLKYALTNAKTIICRSGYSSIMDLDFLCRTAILVPTPGQTEQEYLAKYLQDRFTIIEQENLEKELLKKNDKRMSDKR